MTSPINLPGRAVVGRVVLVAGVGTFTDDTPTLNKGMGGQGVLSMPLPYHGWVQNLPQIWKDQLTPEQQQPIP